jgi:hypothetical protein
MEIKIKFALNSSVAEPHHFYAAPALGKIFYAAPVFYDCNCC